jgi:hypothetical protein
VTAAQDGRRSRVVAGSVGICGGPTLGSLGGGLRGGPSPNRGSSVRVCRREREVTAGSWEKLKEAERERRRRWWSSRRRGSRWSSGRRHGGGRMRWRGREGTGTGMERGGRLDSGQCRSERIPQDCATEGAYAHFAERDADTAGGATILFFGSFCR